MGSMIIATQQRQFKKVTGTYTNGYSTGNGISLAHTTRPATGVLYDVASNNEMTSLIKFVPYMSASSGASIGVRFLGWNGYIQSGGTTLWMPNVLADFTLLFTGGAVPSITIDGATMYLFSGITQVSGTPAANLYSPRTAAAANVEPCAAILDAGGSEIVTVQFKETAGTATGGILWSEI